MERVQKILSNSGFCSRRRAEELIMKGKVKVNNKTINIGDKAGIKDKIEVDGKIIKQEKKIYIMLNKPMNCVTALRDQKYSTVMDCINISERIFPIGRLDLNTSGLLLLTNDGDFANSIAHPSKEIDKTYLVKLNGKISKEQIRKIETGIKLDDGLTSPAKVSKVKHSVIRITIHEGKNRIIRRMMRKIGFMVTSLERIKVGRLELRSLKAGKWRHLKEYEKEKIFQETSKISLSQINEHEKKKKTFRREKKDSKHYRTKSTKERGFKRSPKVSDGKKPVRVVFPRGKKAIKVDKEIAKGKRVSKEKQNKKENNTESKGSKESNKFKETTGSTKKMIKSKTNSRQNSRSGSKQRPSKTFSKDRSNDNRSKHFRDNKTNSRSNYSSKEKSRGKPFKRDDRSDNKFNNKSDTKSRSNSKSKPFKRDNRSDNRSERVSMTGIKEKSRGKPFKDNGFRRQKKTLKDYENKSSNNKRRSRSNSKSRTNSKPFKRGNRSDKKKTYGKGNSRSKSNSKPRNSSKPFKKNKR